MKKAAPVAHPQPIVHSQPVINFANLPTLGESMKKRKR